MIRPMPLSMAAPTPAPNPDFKVVIDYDDSTMRADLAARLRADEVTEPLGTPLGSRERCIVCGSEYSGTPLVDAPLLQRQLAAVESLIGRFDKEPATQHSGRSVAFALRASLGQAWDAHPTADRKHAEGLYRTDDEEPRPDPLVLIAEWRERADRMEAELRNALRRFRRAPASQRTDAPGYAKDRT